MYGASDFRSSRRLVYNKEERDEEECSDAKR